MFRVIPLIVTRPPEAEDPRLKTPAAKRPTRTTRARTTMTAMIINGVRERRYGYTGGGGAYACVGSDV
jgi:hypothetical protein